MTAVIAKKKVYLGDICQKTGKQKESITTFTKYLDKLDNFDVSSDSSTSVDWLSSHRGDSF